MTEKKTTAKRATSKGPSFAEKCKRVTEIATWLGQVKVELPDRHLARLDRAYRALQGIEPENEARVKICHLLRSYAEQAREHDARHVTELQGFIEAIRGAYEYGYPGNGKVPTPETINRAIDAWRRGRGKRANGRSNKWAATLELLRQAGLDGNIDAGALRKAYDRRNW